MLEDYLSFTKGDSGEETKVQNIAEILEEIRDHAMLTVDDTMLRVSPKVIELPIRRNSFKRAITNLVTNATRFADKITINASTGRKWLTITVDDNGPGISKEAREEVFNAFQRLDHARNQNEGNTGLGPHDRP